ncbi:MAG: hypothetical protein Q7J85_11260 [Bacillota bacterium]|nr:hypothetical protein [Bacillota bacterium]
MLNRDLVRIKHMVDGAGEILRFTHGKKRNDLDNNRLISPPSGGVRRNIIVI